MNSFYRFVSLSAIFWTTVSMSAYTPHETGSRTTASGARAKEGYTCAANFVPIGSVIIYDGHKYYVEDRMHASRSRHVDIFMESHKKAIQFGRSFRRKRKPKNKNMNRQRKKSRSGLMNLYRKMNPYRKQNSTDPLPIFLRLLRF